MTTERRDIARAAQKPRPVALSVRDLALPAPRVGSIETHSGLGNAPELGVELHQRLQERRAAMYPGYRPEVQLAQTLAAGPYEFRVTGRVDGILPGTPPILEEIKSAFDPDALLRKLESAAEHPYRLQLLTYGYFYWRQHTVIPELRLTIVSARSGALRELPLALDLGFYESWLARRLVELEREERARRRLAARRRRLAGKLRFPFATPRPGQAELMADLATALADQPHVALQAPTGLGKTIGVLYPNLVEALARGSPVVYVTPKNSQHRVAEDAAARLRAQGGCARTLTLTAKSRICMLPEPTCSPDRCPYAREHYTKVAAADLASKLARRSHVTARTLRAVAHRQEVCPYELSLEIAPMFDVVIGDYNYVIDSQSLATRIGASLRGKNTGPNLVVDEAHNLPTRACDNLSATLSRQVVMTLRSRLATLPEPFATSGTAATDAALELIAAGAPTRPGTGNAAATTTGRARIDLGAGMRLGERIAALQAAYLASDVAIGEDDPVLALADAWAAFATALATAGDAFVPLHERSRTDEALRIICCDASEHLRERWADFAHVTLFSATLKPFDYYARLSGLDLARLHTSEYLSPFSPANRKLLVIPQVSTKLRDRSRHTGRIAEAITRITAVRPGNYVVFFPSYAFLVAVAAKLAAPGFRLLQQKPAMSHAETAACLATLAARAEPTLLLAVQGGSFAEGVDFAGEMLIGAIIVGPGLPTADPTREILRDYYERHYGSGDDWAYTYPAMTKVVQAAGRVIRSESDRGLIVLMDRRFTEPRYATLMPRDWYGDTVTELVSTSILADVGRFWAADGAAP